MRFTDGFERREALLAEMELIIDCLEELRSKGVAELRTLRATLYFNFDQLVVEVTTIDRRMRACREGQHHSTHSSAPTSAKPSRCFANRKAAG